VREATDAELLRVHDAGYLARVNEFESAGGGRIEPDTWINTGTRHAARLAAGAAVEAVDAVLKGPNPIAFCAIRPPGHHARPHDAMGFCVYGNAGVAAAHALAAHELNRVLVVDFDVHHGNGTQEMFYDDPRVAFLSIHRAPFYPGTGARDETGTGRGLGFTCNIPLTHGVPRADYHAAFRKGLHALADHARPELVIVSAGFDAHAEDPVGDLGLDFEDFEALTKDVIEVARTHAQGRLVSLMEGGYNTSILAGCVETHLRTLLAAPPASPA
jgi:acetoin utilization deacetylase AcuC-like enzyme